MVLHELHPLFLVQDQQEQNEEHIFHLKNSTTKKKVHSSRCSLYVYTHGFIVVNIDTFTLSIRFTTKYTSGINAMFFGYDFPKLINRSSIISYDDQILVHLRADLISTLTNLNMNDFTHFVFDLKESRIRLVCNIEEDMHWNELNLRENNCRLSDKNEKEEKRLDK